MPMRILLRLQRMGILKDTNEYSLLRRILRINDLIKLRKKAKIFIPDFWGTLVRILRGDYQITLQLPEPVSLYITPSNLVALIKITGELPIAAIDASHNRIEWEIAPGRKVVTHTDKGLDLPALYEIFIAKSYKGNYDGMRIIDVGAYRGESSIFFALHGASEILCIEPSPNAADKVQENIQLSLFEDRIKFFPVALSGKSGTVSFLLTSDEASNSHIVNDVMRTQNKDLHVQVPAYDLEHIMKEVGWETVDVVKMDCEGCEYAILAQTPETILRKVRVWIMEFHYKGSTPLVERFKALGYEVEYEEYPDGLGMLRAWLPGAPLPWNKY